VVHGTVSNAKVHHVPGQHEVGLAVKGLPVAGRNKTTPSGLITIVRGQNRGAGVGKALHARAGGALRIVQWRKVGGGRIRHQDIIHEGVVVPGEGDLTLGVAGTGRWRATRVCAVGGDVSGQPAVVRIRAVAGRAGEWSCVGRGHGVGNKMVENAGGVWETVVAAVCGVVEQQLLPTRSRASHTSN
jgi:hypothetical protein